MTPRTITRWQDGKPVRSQAVPTPFGPERAQAIWSARGPARALDDAMTDGELAFVAAVWDGLPGNPTWMDAFHSIQNGSP